MKDNTAAARLERGMAQLQVLLVNLSTLIGRLERVSATLSVGGASATPPSLSPAQPPIVDGDGVSS